MQNSVITIGTFDGVHLGHQFLIKKVLEISFEEGLKSVVITFDPHPRSVLDTQYKPFIITSNSKKSQLIKSFGIKEVTILKFNEELANLTTEEFVKQILIQKFNLKHLVIGFDSALGKNRQGDYNFLLKLGKKEGFKVTQLPELKFDEIRPSSGKIRDLIKQNKVQEANQLLGWEYEKG
jgi:riboflavin kinase/FMN adenylyltransferase